MLSEPTFCSLSGAEGTKWLWSLNKVTKKVFEQSRNAFLGVRFGDFGFASATCTEPAEVRSANHIVVISAPLNHHNSELYFGG